MERRSWLSKKKGLPGREPFFGLEIPLKRYGRIDEERLVVVSVVDEVVAELNLATEADVLSDIIPELRFGEDDEHTVALMTWAPVLTSPEIDEA